jgi:hypothetical protein
MEQVMSDVVFSRTSTSPLLSRGAVQRLWSDEPRFFATAIFIAVASLPLLFAALVDSREFLGVPVWEKPLKFHLATSTYLLTLAFFARYLPAATREKRWYRIFSGAVAGAILLELAWIDVAAGLGTASHFNRTPLGGIFYTLAGLGAVIMTSASAVFAFQIGRNGATGLAPALKESLVIGLALVLPLTLITAGTMSSGSGHWVGGTPADPSGLFFFGWARDVGDLRVSHFFATHALQFIPLFGLAYDRAGGRDRWPVRLVALAFVAFVVFLYVQALMGQPFAPWLG